MQSERILGQHFFFTRWYTEAEVVAMCNGAATRPEIQRAKLSLVGVTQEA